MIISDEALPLIKESLERELRLLESKVNLIKRELGDFEAKYKLASNEFIKQFDEGKLGDSQEYFEWWGLLNGLKKLEEKIELTKAVLSSC